MIYVYGAALAVVLALAIYHNFKPRDACCPAFKYHLEQKCSNHADLHDCPDIPIIKQSTGAYSIPIRDGGGSFYQIYFCPWCGEQLP